MTNTDALMCINHYATLSCFKLSFVSQNSNDSGQIALRPFKPPVGHLGLMVFCKGNPPKMPEIFRLGNYGNLPRSLILSGQFIATSAEVTPNGGLVRESHQNFLK